MKKNFLIFIMIFLSLLFIPSCNKSEATVESSPEVTMRSGGALIFYIASLSMDNRLVVPAQDSVRRHTIFNKERVESVVGNETGQGIADVFGVVCRHYEIDIVFKDGSELTQYAYAIDAGAHFEVDVSKCIQVLKPSYNANFVQIERLNEVEKKYNLWRDEVKYLNYVQVRKDGTIVGKFLLDPLEYPQIQFSPKHQHI